MPEFANSGPHAHGPIVDVHELPKATTHRVSAVGAALQIATEGHPSAQAALQEAEANMRLLEQSLKSGSAALHRKHVSLFAAIPSGGQPTTSLDPVWTA